MGFSWLIPRSAASLSSYWGELLGSGTTAVTATSVPNLLPPWPRPGHDFLVWPWLITGDLPYDAWPIFGSDSDPDFPVSPSWHLASEATAPAALLLSFLSSSWDSLTCPSVWWFSSIFHCELCLDLLVHMNLWTIVFDRKYRSKLFNTTWFPSFLDSVCLKLLFSILFL